MLHKSALKMTDALSRHVNMPEKEKCIYVYGFELLFSTLISMSSVLVISLLVHNIFFFLFFILFFFSLRLFCGGYHANTYIKCFIITNSIFISTIILAKAVVALNLKIVMPVLAAAAFLLIVCFAPIENENHPYSKARYKKFKMISRILAAVYLLLYICLYIFIDSDIIVVNAAWSYIWVALMIIIAKIQKKGGKSDE